MNIYVFLIILIFDLIFIIYYHILRIMNPISRYDDDNLETSERNDEKFFNWDVDKTTIKVPTQYPAIVWRSYGMRPDTTTISCPDDIKCEVFAYEDSILPENVAAYLFFAATMRFDINRNHLPIPPIYRPGGELVRSFKKLPLPRQPHKILWGLYNSESPIQRPALMHEEALSLFNFSSTFSRYSDVPFPLQSAISLEYIKTKKYFVKTSVKNSFLNKIAPILYLQSNCQTFTNRDAYVKELMEFIKVDSYGACLRNKIMNNNLTKGHMYKFQNDGILKLIAKYKFIIGIENAVCDDYITEKLWRAIHVGTVPIYFGSPTVKDWLPNPKSAILLKDFPTPKILSKYIKKLMHDDKLYEEFLEHKIIGKVTNKRIIREFKERSYKSGILARRYEFECFACKRVHETTNKNQTEVNIVTKEHLNCPKPISALKLGVDPFNYWVTEWDARKNHLQDLYKNISKIM